VSQRKARKARGVQSSDKVSPAARATARSPNPPASICSATNMSGGFTVAELRW
jgi:hypothetical protein